MSLKRVGLVGYGYWGTNIASNLQKLDMSQLIEFVGIAEPNKEKQIACVAKLSLNTPKINIFSSMQEMLAGPKIDAVILAAPPDQNMNLIFLAVVNGLDVLVEKPLMLSYNQAIALDLIAEENNATTKVWIDYTPLYDSNMLAIRNLLNTLPHGSIQHILAVRANNSPDRVNKVNYSAMWDLASHDIALLDSLNKSIGHPIHIRATGSKEYTTLNLTYPSGLRATVISGWTSVNKQRLLSIAGDNFYMSDTSNFTLPNYINFPPSAPFTHISTEGVEKVVSPIVEYPDHDSYMLEPLYKLLEDFLCDSDKYLDYTKPDLVLGTRVLKVLLAAERSLISQKVENIK